jgi:hypothetical protein
MVQSGEGHQQNHSTEFVREIARNPRVVMDNVGDAGNAARISCCHLWNGWKPDFGEANKCGDKHYAPFLASVPCHLRLATNADNISASRRRSTAAIPRTRKNSAVNICLWSKHYPTQCIARIQIPQDNALSVFVLLAGLYPVLPGTADGPS